MTLYPNLLMSPSDTIRYEQPLNERMRVFLRLEQLLSRFDHNHKGNGHWDHHQSLMDLLEIYTLTTKGDMKSEIMKELERHISNWKRFQDQPEVDQELLENVTAKHRAWINQLRSMSGPLGQHLKNNDFFNGLRQRSSIPGGTCDFDMPLYHHWRNKPHEEIRHQLQEWIAPYLRVGEAVSHILEVIRRSAQSDTIDITNGFFQQSLDPQLPNQIISINLPKSAGFYPEISAGRHRYSIRLMRLEHLDSRPLPYTKDTSVDVTLYSV